MNPGPHFISKPRGPMRATRGALPTRIRSLSLRVMVPGIYVSRRFWKVSPVFGKAVHEVGDRHEEQGAGVKDEGPDAPPARFPEKVTAPITS